MAGHTDRSIFIDAPPNLVWQEINDISHWPTLFAGEYESADVLNSPPDRIRFRLTKPPIDGTRHTWISERYLDTAARTVVARRVDTGPFRYMHIFQSVTPHDSGSVLRWVQDFEVETNAPFTDTQMQERIERGSALNQSQHRSAIEQLAGRPPRAFEQQGNELPRAAHGASLTGHVDVRVSAQAPLERVWAIANDRTAWAHTGHPVSAAFDEGPESVFTVHTPPNEADQRWSFTVHRVRNDESKTVFSRRYGSPDFLYSTQWFGYRETGGETELRCVSDFELTPAADVHRADMEQTMGSAMTGNMTRIAQLAETATQPVLEPR